MRVDVQEHPELSLRVLVESLFQLVSDYFDLVAPILLSFWVIIGVEMSVHIFALEVRSVISSHYTVRVHNGDDPHLVLVSELVGQHRPRQYIIDEAMYNEA